MSQNINILNIHNASNKIKIEYDESDAKFTIRDASNNSLGTFGPLQIIKYITKDICDTFHKSCEYETSICIIEKYVCKCDSANKPTIISYLESPFTGNLEKFYQLYTLINKIDNTDEFAKFDDNDSDEHQHICTIRNRLKDFNYILLNHILKLSVLISGAIKDKHTEHSIKLRESLFTYTIMAFNKISHIIKESIDDKILEYNILENEVSRMYQIKENGDVRFSAFEEQVAKQNAKITQVLQGIPEISVNVTNGTTSQISSHDAVVVIDNDNGNGNGNGNGNFNDSDYGFSDEQYDDGENLTGFEQIMAK